MPNFPHSSSASATCHSPIETFEGRIEWRPSVAVGGALIAFGLLAAVSLLASNLPAAIAWPAAALVPAWGLWLAGRERRRAPVRLAWCGDGVLFVGGARVEDPRLQWRGPLAFLAWRDGGRIRRLAWWPDTLSAAGRRELRLAAMAAEAARRQARMAT